MPTRRIVRAAMTQTVNAYRDMPARTDQLGQLAGKLDAIRQANLEHHAALLSAAKKQGVRVACLGELFPAPYFALRQDALWLDLAEDALEGPSVRFMSDVAHDLGMIIVAPIYEVDRRTGRRFNTAVVIDEHGETIGRYRKTHIPQGTNEQGSFLERFYYQESDGELGTWPANVSKSPFFPVFETSLGRIGVAICYDRHFPGAMWTLAREGAELIVSPAVTFGQKSNRMWHLEFPVDACRFSVFVGGSNRKGAEPPWNQPYFGESYFSGPNGVLPELSTHPELTIADLDLDSLKEPDPAGWNLLRDTRFDIYRLGPEGNSASD